MELTLQSAITSSPLRRTSATSIPQPKYISKIGWGTTAAAFDIHERLR